MAEYSTRNRSKLFKSGLVDTSDIKNAAVTLDKLAPEVVAEYAAKTYVDTAVSNLIDSAPGVLDTLNELAAAINDDANFFTTVNNSIATKLNSADFDSTFDTRLASKDTDDLTEGSNLYFTDARVQTKLGNISGHLIPDANITYDLGSATYRFRDLYLSGNTIYLDGITLSNDNGTFSVTTESNQPVVLSLSANTTSDLAEGSNLYYTEARVDANIALKTTADITEGTNLYWTVARGEAMFDTRLTTKTTDNLVEGSTNQYFTTARARASVSASDGLSYSPSTGIFSIADTGVTAGSYGSASLVPVITVNANGQITSASTVAVAGVTNFTYTAGTNTYSISTADGGLFSASGDLSSFDTGDLTEGVNLYYTTARWDARLATKTTDDLTEGSNLYYTTARWDARLATKTTNDLTEGTNLYYTDSRVRNAISVVDSGGDGSLSYNSTSGVITYTGPSATEVRAHFSAGTGVTYSAGQFSIGQAVATTSNVTFADINASGNLVIDGNLTVNGTTTTISATNLAIEDNLIYLNEGSTAANPDLGITGNYNDGTYAHTGVFRDATDNRWKFFKGYTPEPGTSIDTTHASFSYADVQGGTFYGAFSGNASTASTWQTARTNTVTLTGDVAGSGSASVDGSGNWTVSVATTVQANSVALGTDTTGNYMVDVAAGSGITVSHTQGEGSTATVSHADTSSVANLSSDNANGVVIQDVALTFDTYGHVQTATVATVDLDGRYYTETEADSRFVNVTGDTMTGSLHINSDDGVRATYQSTDGTTWLRGWGIESNRGTAYLRPTGNNTQTLNIGYSAGSQLWNTINLGASGINAEGVITATSGGHRFGNLLVGEGTYKNSITPIGDSNMNLNTPSGSVYVTTNIRSPIFYDSNDTNYYLDAASTSNLNGLTTASIITANGGIYATKIGIASSNLNDVTNGAPWYGLGASTQTGWYGNQQTVQLAGYFGLTLKSSGAAIELEPYGATGFVKIPTGHLHIGSQSTPDNPGGWNRTITIDGVNHSRLRLKASAYGSYGANEAYFWHDNTVTPNTGIVAPDALYLNASYTQIANSARAPLFYDLDDTGYYVDPAGQSKIHNLIIQGDWGNYGAPWNGQLTIRGGYPSVQFRSSTSNSVWLRHMDGSGEIQHYYGSGGIDTNDWSIKHTMYKDGTFYSAASMRSPIFYDANDTSYYSDPNGTSRFAKIVQDQRYDACNIGTYGGYYGSGDWQSLTNSEGQFNVVQVNNITSGNYSNYPSGVYTYGSILSWRTTNHSFQLYAAHTGSLAYKTQWNNDNYSGWLYPVVYGRNEASSSVYGTTFYDANDTNYYVDPNSWSQLNHGNFNSSPSGRTLSLGGDQTNRVYNDSARASLVINASYYPHLYMNAVDDSGNTTHGAVLSMTGILTAGGYRRWGMGIANRNPNELSFGWYDNNSNPHYGVGINWSYPASMWIDTDHNLYARGSMRAPIFYDYNDTAWYVDPASTSRTRNIDVCSGSYSSSYYDAAIEVREYNMDGAGDDTWARAPRIGFHWGGRVASSIAMSSNGWINIMNNPGTGFEAFRASDIYATGNVTAYYSDERLKTKVGTIENALDKVVAIETFLYVNNDIAKENGFIGDEIQVGVSAQSVEKVLPEVVKHAPFDMHSQDGEIVSKTGEWYKTVQYDRLVPLLIEAIKEQQTTIETQQSVINTQEERIARLEALVQQMLDK